MSCLVLVHKIFLTDYIVGLSITNDQSLIADTAGEVHDALQKFSDLRPGSVKKNLT